MELQKLPANIFSMFVKEKGRRKLFYGGGTEQKCRPPWLADDEKRPIVVPQKTKFGPKYKKSHIWDSFFGNIISGIQSFYIYPDVPADIIRVFF